MPLIRKPFVPSSVARSKGCGAVSKTRASNDSNREATAKYEHVARRNSRDCKPLNRFRRGDRDLDLARANRLRIMLVMLKVTFNP